MIRATCIFRNKTDLFHESFAAKSDAEKWEYLQGPTAHAIGLSVKIGDGSFRARVDLHTIQQGPHTIAYSLERRRGYLLGVFIFAKATR